MFFLCQAPKVIRDPDLLNGAHGNFSNCMANLEHSAWT